MSEIKYNYTGVTSSSADEDRIAELVFQALEHAAKFMNDTAHGTLDQINRYVAEKMPNLSAVEYLNIGGMMLHYYAKITGTRI